MPVELVIAPEAELDIAEAYPGVNPAVLPGFLISERSYSQVFPSRTAGTVSGCSRLVIKSR